LARFTHRIQLPGLTQRRDDIPLVLAHLLRRVAEGNPLVAKRFFERRNGALAEPRIAPALIVRLLRHTFTHHVRELERLIWLAIESAPAYYLDVTPDVANELAESADSAAVTPTEIDRETLVRALAEHGRSPSRVAKALGLKNRYVLIRLLKKHGLSAGED